MTSRGTQVQVLAGFGVERGAFVADDALQITDPPGEAIDAAIRRATAAPSVGRQDAGAAPSDRWAAPSVQ
jgi:hypothetical protein